MNELLFLIYSVLVAASLLIALRIGKESLIALIGLYWVFANFFVTKEITLLGLTATASDALAIGATLGLNLVQEYFGAASARKTIVIGFYGLIIFGMISLFQCSFTPALCDVMHPYFVVLLTPQARIAAASLFVYCISQTCEYWLYQFFQSRLSGRHFILRNYLSVSISQLVDTVLFSFVGLYGIIDNIGQIILISYSIKMLTLLIAAPFLSLSRVVMRKSHV